MSILMKQFAVEKGCLWCSSSDVRCACNDIHMLRCSLADKATAETLKRSLVVLVCLFGATLPCLYSTVWLLEGLSVWDIYSSTALWNPIKCVWSSVACVLLTTILANVADALEGPSLVKVFFKRCWCTGRAVPGEGLL